VRLQDLSSQKAITRRHINYQLSIMIKKKPYQFCRNYTEIILVALCIYLYIGTWLLVWTQWTLSWYCQELIWSMQLASYFDLCSLCLNWMQPFLLLQVSFFFLLKSYGHY
jgi:hypothetical protein